MSFKYEYVAIKTSPFGLMTNCGPCYNRPGKGGWGGNGDGNYSVIIDEIDNVRASIEEFKGVQVSEFQAVALKYTKMRTDFYDTYGEINETFQLISDANGTTAENILELFAATEEAKASLVTTNKAVANHSGALASIDNRLEVEFLPRFGVVESSIQDFKEVQASENLATALSMERLDSKVNDNEASILEEKTTRADQYSSMSEILTEIKSSTEDNAANITSKDKTYTDRFTANASRMTEIEAETESSSGKITNLEEVTADINRVVVSQGSTLNARIDNISIGGRNLLRNADFKLGVSTWGFASITNSEDTLGNLLTVTNIGTSADFFGLKPLNKFETITLIEGREYVLSFYANGNIDEINNIEIKNNRGVSQKLNNAPITSTLYDRTEIVFTAEFSTEIGSLFISAIGYPKDSWFNVVAVQIEQGNIASDWTMAPEDTGEIIEQVEANIEAYKEAQALINLATAEDYSNMQTTVGENTGELERLDRLVVTNENAIGTIYTKLETDIDGNIAQIIEDYKAVSSDIGAMGTKLDGVYAQTNPVMMGSEEVMIGSEQHYAGVWTETGARIEQGLAESFRIDALKAEVGLNKGEIEKVDKLVVTNTEAIGTINTKLEVSIENDIAQIFDDYKVVVNKVDEVQSQVNPIMIGSTEFLIGNNEVLIGEWSETSARLEEDFVAATKLTKVETELNGNTSKVETLSESVNGLSASWSVQLNVNGKVSGIYQHSTGNSSGFDILADKFSVGTDTRMVKPFSIIGNDIVFNGKVSFNSVTGTEVIDKAINDISNLEYGGRNLLKDSSVSVTSSSYAMAEYPIVDSLKEGETVTVTLWGSLGSSKESFTVYNSGGSGGNVLTQVRPGVYQLTFPWKVYFTNSFLRVYHMPNSPAVNSTINRIKLERGNKPTSWTPAPEDVQGIVKNIYYPNTTKIDGSKIETGSIDAGSINVGELSALSANMGTITSGSIKIGSISGSTDTSGNTADPSNGTMFKVSDGTHGAMGFRLISRDATGGIELSSYSRAFTVWEGNTIRVKAGKLS